MTAAPRSILTSPWWYAGLTVVVFAAYWATSVGHPGRPLKLRPVTPAIGEDADASLWRQPLDVQHARRVLEQRPRVAGLLGLWTLLAAGLGVAGIWLSVRGAFRGALTRVFAYPSRLMLAWSWSEAGKMLWLVILFAGLLPLAHVRLAESGWLPLAHERIWTVVTMGLLDLFVVLIIWSFAARKAPPAAALFGPGGTRERAIRESLATYVACFPWMFGLLWVALTVAGALGIEPQVEAIHELLFVEARPQTLVLTVLLACVIGPVAEECLFRGVLFGALRRYSSRGVALLASSALFAAMHTNLVGFFPIFALGGLLAVLYERSGSLAGPIAVHIVHNTLLVGLGLTARELL